MVNSSNKIESLLKKAGYSKRYKGYKQLINCIQLLLDDEDKICSIVKLYEQTAKNYKVTWKCVEKNIRTANEAAWLKSGGQFIAQISRRSYLVVPETKELLEIFLDYLSGE